MLGLPRLEKRPEVLHVQVPANARAVAVLGIEESSLGDDDPCMADLVAEQVRSGLIVACVGHERDVH